GLAFIVKSSPVKGIAAMAGAPLLFALGVPNGAMVKRGVDFKGPKSCASTRTAATTATISAACPQRGWGFAGRTPAPGGETAARVAAVRSKALDGCIVDLASALNYVQRGDGRILLRFGDLVKDFHIHVIFATDKIIAEKPQALRVFLAGWFETIRLMRKDKQMSVEIAADVMGTDAQTAAQIYDELMPMFSDTGRFDPKALAVLRRSFVEMKTLPDEPDMSKLYTEAFLLKP